MIRFYKLILIPAIVIIMMGALTGFGTPDEDKLAQNLILKRTKILQQAFYGRIEEETAIERLKKIETYPIYNKDVNFIKNLEETNIDIVRDIEFVGVEETSKLLNYLSYDMNIKWTMRGLSGDYRTMGRYSVVLKSVNNVYKLSEFQLIDNAI